MGVMKDRIEEACRKAGMRPEVRETYREHDIFVAEGYSVMPEITYARFGAGVGEFPDGCFCAIWWLATGEDKFDVGCPIFFHADHDSEYDYATRRQARINTALRDARHHLDQRLKVRADA